MDSYIKLAKEIHQRNNPTRIGICVGEVTSLTPVNIRVYYSGVALDFDEFFSIKRLVNGNKGVTTGVLYVEEYPINIGDKFICIAGNDNQSLYVLGRLESIKSLNIYLEG